MVGRNLTLLHYYSLMPMFHIMHAREVLSFVDLLHHQHETGDDSAQNDGVETILSAGITTLEDY